MKEMVKIEQHSKLDSKQAYQKLCYVKAHHENLQNSEITDLVKIRTNGKMQG